MTGWPHGHLAHAVVGWLKSKTSAGDRGYVQVPEERTYPLFVASEAGLGTLGTDPAIQADEVRLQVDAWSEHKAEAMNLAAELFELLDARFKTTALLSTTITATDSAGTVYECKVERVARSGGGDPWYDSTARCWRVTAFFNVKVNL